MATPKLHLDPTEVSLGISTYLSPHISGFSAVSKARYSDFIVHEVNLEGQEARLESMEPLAKNGIINEAKQQHVAEEDSRKRKRDEDNGEKDVNNDKDNHDDNDWDAIRLDLSNIVGDSIANDVCAFLQNKQETTTTTSSTADSQKFIMLPSLPEKDKRREFHQWIKLRLSHCALADTVQDGVIRVWHKSFENDMPKKFDNQNNNRKQRQKNQRQVAAAPEGYNYLRFVLYKENLDTGTAVSQIQNRTIGGGGYHRGGKGGGNKHKIRAGFAGNKDKRGITSQFITVPAKTSIESLCSWNRPGQGAGHTKGGGVAIMRLGNFEYVKEELRLGRLQGNRFDIVLRNVKLDEECLDNDSTTVVQNAARAVKEAGFINYFGAQRFGKYHDTHFTGMAVLQGNYEKAVEIIMRPKGGENDQVATARKEWQERFSGDGDRAKQEQECANRVVKHFGRFLTIEAAVLNSLARYPLDYKRAFSCIAKTMRMMFIHAVQSFLWNSVASYRIEKLGMKVVEGDLVLDRNVPTNPDQANHGIPSVKAVTKEDVENNNYTIEDVVLPLFGSKTCMPTNETGHLFDKVMEAHGLTQGMLSKFRDPDLTCMGDYRLVVCRPKDVDVSVVKYQDELQPLLQTDLMKLNNITLENKLDDQAESLLAAVVGFTLPSSSYATIFLRELMKRPTSMEYQRNLELGK